VASNKQVLVGTVGYALLGNHSVGPVLLPRLKDLDWPEGVTVDELNWGPIAVVQQFEALETPYERVVLLVAIERPERDIGEISIYHWKGGLPDEKQIQACVGDATTGVISSDNLLVIGEFFKIWPNDVFLVDVEPGPEVSGEHFTTDFGVKVPEILEIVQRIAIEGINEDDEVQILRGYELFEKGQEGSLAK
jgi:hypothetical protein